MALRPSELTNVLKTEVYKLKVRGMNNSQIKEAMARRGHRLTTSNITTFCQQISTEFQEARRRSMKDRIDQELAMLEHIRNEALDAYGRSTDDAVSHEESIETGGPDNPIPAVGGNDALAALLNAGVGGRRTQKTIRRGQSGDPNHLKVALMASADIRKMLKIEPEEVKRIELVTREVAGYTQEELQRMDATELARILEQEIQGSAST